MMCFFWSHNAPLHQLRILGVPTLSSSGFLHLLPAPSGGLFGIPWKLSTSASWYWLFEVLCSLLFLDSKTRTNVRFLFLFLLELTSRKGKRKKGEFALERKTLLWVNQWNWHPAAVEAVVSVNRFSSTPAGDAFGPLVFQLQNLSVFWHGGCSIWPSRRPCLHTFLGLISLCLAGAVRIYSFICWVPLPTHPPQIPRTPLCTLFCTTENLQNRYAAIAHKHLSKFKP